MKNEFMIGCNYWASNAGTEMWRQWDARVVEDDLKKLKQYGIKYLRVFPNWRDFQPVHPLLDSGMGIKDYRLHDAELPQNPYYLDETMLERFGIFCDIAEKHGLRLIVAILTGGMSGRGFMPPVVYGRSIASDPTALIFEQKFIKGIVELFRDKKAICAWDLGNECNYFINAKTREEALNWTMIVSNAVRASDSSRPLVSGMCGLSTEGAWRIRDQADHTDILTTHPYPFWVPHCSQAEITSIQTLLHATCETKYYSDIGGKPCLVEEIGTMGPMVCDDKTAGDFMRLNLYSNWVNGAGGVMWWCANEQIDLDFPPYDYLMCEVELGMFDRNGKAKPVLHEVKKFADYLRATDLELPPAEEDAVCLVSAGQDQWGVGYSAYVLAKQAGVNIRFADAVAEIPHAKVYLLPSIKNNYVMTGQSYKKLKQRVANGATLYISNDNGILSDFRELTGLTVNNTRTQADSGVFEWNGRTIRYSRSRNYLITADRAEVIARDESGMPIFTKFRYGKGTVYYLNFPLEQNAVDVCDAFESEQYGVYDEIFRATKEDYALTYDNSHIGMTRHMSGDAQLVTLINYSPKPQTVGARLRDGYACEIIKGDLESIAPFELTIVKLTRSRS